MSLKVHVEPHEGVICFTYASCPSAGPEFLNVFFPGRGCQAAPVCGDKRSKCTGEVTLTSQLIQSQFYSLTLENKSLLTCLKSAVCLSWSSIRSVHRPAGRRAAEPQTHRVRPHRGRPIGSVRSRGRRPQPTEGGRLLRPG